jgi:hypothetical protein
VTGSDERKGGNVGRGDRAEEPQPSAQLAAVGSLLMGNQRDHVPIGTGSPGPPGPVDVVRVIGRRVEGDHEGHRVDVDPPSGDICGDEDIELAGSKRSERAFALHLAAVPVDRGRL